MGKLGKILIHTPGHWLNSGYGKNTKYIAKYLAEDFDIVMVSNQINTDLTTPLVSKEGYIIYGSVQQFGIPYLLPVYMKERADVMLTIWDVWIYIDWVDRSKKYIDKNKINWVPYCPVDAPLNEESMIVDALKEARHILVFSKFGYNEVTKFFSPSKVTIIPHGIDTTIHQPHDKEEAYKVLFKEMPELMQYIKLDQFYYLFVGEGTSGRKDEAGLLRAFKILLDKYKLKGKVKLIMKLSQPHSPGANYDVIGIMRKLKLDDDVILMYAKIPEITLSYLYDLSDAYVSMSMGEGWGLPVTEAMAHGKPVILSKNSAHTEQVEDSQAGILVDTIPGAEREQLWTETLQEYPLTDPSKFADAMYEMYRIYNEEPEKYKKMSENAVKYAKEHDWSIVGPKFNEFFRKYLGYL